MLDFSSLRTAFQAAAQVTQMALVTVVGVWLGSWLDSQLGTEPWLLLLCALVAGAGGMYRLFRGLSDLQGEDDSDPPNAP